MHAFLEIELGFARHDGGEMEDHFRPAVDGGACGGRIGNVGSDRLYPPGEFLRSVRRTQVEEGELLDRPIVKRARSDQTRCQLAADHPCRTGNKNVHCFAR